MGLRRQLTLLAILFLLLPIAGFLFLREMEQLLRLGQERGLLASARAVADRIESEPELLQLVTSSTDTSSSTSLYAFASDPLITLDGYDDDWRFLKLEKQRFEFDSFTWSLKLLKQGEQVLGFLSVQDSTFDDHHPSAGFPASGDFVGLFQKNLEGNTLLVLRTSTQGEMQIVTSSNGETTEIIHHSRAIWRESAEGYQVEFSIPQRYFNHAVSLGVYNKSTNQWLSNAGMADIDSAQLLASLQRWPASAAVLQDALLQASTEVFAHKGNRIRIVNRKGWILADENRLYETNDATPPMAWLIKRMMNDSPMSQVEREIRQSRLTAPEVTESMSSGTVGSRWYRWDQSNHLVRLSVPIFDYNGDGPVTVGSVVVEQTTQQWLALADRAFKRMMVYSVCVVGLLTLLLFLYATWLGLRIRRLSRAVNSAVNVDGSVKGVISATVFPDEIGDLQKNYADLLAKVAQYNDYLKTLASKLSHELRTPLAIVSSSLENLNASHQLSSDASVYIVRAQEGADRLTQIFNAMNSARSVEDSIVHADIELIDLSALLASLCEAYAELAVQQSLVLTTQLEDKAIQVRASGDLLVQMLDKLFDNAVDFCSPEGEITIGIKQTNGQVQLWVRNTGSTLPPTMTEQIFTSMVSVRQGRGETMHLGLGLHIVKLIVDFHQGQIRASNLTDGSGVSFDVYLPLH